MIWISDDEIKSAVIKEIKSQLSEEVLTKLKLYVYPVDKFVDDITQELITTAVHEAGHLLMAIDRGIPVKSVELSTVEQFAQLMLPNEDSNEDDKHRSIPVGRTNRLLIGRGLRTEESYINYLSVLLAGAEATKVLLNLKINPGNLSDFTEVNKILYKMSVLMGFSGDIFRMPDGHLSNTQETYISCTLGKVNSMIKSTLTTYKETLNALALSLLNNTLDGVDTIEFTGIYTMKALNVLLQDTCSRYNKVVEF